MIYYKETTPQVARRSESQVAYRCTNDTCLIPLKT